ncbi:hypothetical protein KL918_002592 [Ogataea parapolymorpha]|nr:hypothetical protein KL918_002592 [Ogataea parapolymorpha]KAG7870853.1 hypothetical protein KL916_004584 [Ogataea parapolymorpha]
MFRKVTRVQLSQLLRRCQSTHATETTRPRSGNSLMNLVHDDTVTLSQFFERVERSVSKLSDTRVERNLPLGHILMNKLQTLNKDNAVVKDSVLFNRFVDIWGENKLLHASHADRAVRRLLVESKYDKALELWQRLLEKLKEEPDGFKETREARFTSEAVFRTTGIVAYVLKTLSENAVPDAATLDLLAGGVKLSPRLVDFVLQPLELDDATTEKVKSAINGHFFKPDPNSPALLTAAFVAATEGRYDRVEAIIRKLYTAREKSQEPFSEQTYAKLMELCAITGKYQQAQQLWAELTKAGVKPTVQTWNQLLNVHAKSDAPQKLLRIESVYRLLRESVQPDAQTVGLMIYGYLGCRELKKALDFYRAQKDAASAQEVWDIRNTLLRGLVQNDYVAEAEKFYNVFRAEAKAQNVAFEPDIRFYNSLLRHLFAKDDVDKALATMDEILGSDTLAPDVATYTTIIDVLGMKASRTGVPVEVEIQKLIDTMMSSKIKPSVRTTGALVKMLAAKPETIAIAEQLVEQLKKDKRRISDVIYSTMVTAESSQGNVSKAMEYFYAALEAGVPMTTQFYNSIFRGFSINPDVRGLRRFFEFVQKNATQKPNFYTFYYMLRAAAIQDDHVLAQYVIDELAEAELQDLGTRLPQMLERYKKAGLDVPARLLQPTPNH